MKSTSMTPLERKGLKARAHFLDPVVMIGDAGLTPGVVREIERNLAAHELIKVRVAGQDRDAREALLLDICNATGATPIQHIGKLLVVYLPTSKPADDAKALAPKKPAKTTRSTTRTPAKRNPVSGRTMAPRPGQVPVSTRKAPSGIRPPRTARVRKSGQRSAKKPFQDS